MTGIIFIFLCIDFLKSERYTHFTGSIFNFYTIHTKIHLIGSQLYWPISSIKSVNYFQFILAIVLHLNFSQNLCIISNLSSISSGNRIKLPIKINDQHYLLHRTMSPPHQSHYLDPTSCSLCAHASNTDDKTRRILQTESKSTMWTHATFPMHRASNAQSTWTN